MKVHDEKWNNQAVPRDGAIVYVLATDHKGKYEVPFHVLFKNDSWLNAITHEELDVFVAAWRPADLVDARRALETEAR